MRPPLQRFEGCLVGLAVGSALGGPVSYLSPEQIEQKHQGRVTDMIGGGSRDLRPGEYSDAARLTFSLARSVILRGRFDPEDIGRRFVELFRGRSPNLDVTTSAALKALSGGGHWSEVGEQARLQSGDQLAGNGALVRAVPLALLDWNDAPAILADTIDSVRITHADQRVYWAAAALNLIIAALLRGQLDGIIPRTTALVNNAEVRSALESFDRLSPGELPTSGYVLDTLQTGLWCAFAAENFEDALIQAVNLGHDAATVGAVTGAVAGAIHGLYSIPDRWRRTIHDYEEITGIAGDLYGLSSHF